VVNFTHQYHSLSSAQTATDSNEVRAVLTIPHDVNQRLVRHPSVGFGVPPSTKQDNNNRPITQWLVDGSDIMIVASIKSLRNMPLVELLDKPANRNTATFEVTLLYNPEQKSVVNIVPGLVAVILTMTMIIFTSATIVREQEHNNMEMLITTPLAPLELMGGKIVPYIFIGANPSSNYFRRRLLVVPRSGKRGFIVASTGYLLFICTSLVLGLIISTIAKSQLQSIQMTVFLLLTSILLSGFIFPYEGMPSAAQYIAETFPATHFIRLICRLILRDAEVFDMSYDMLWLLIFAKLGLMLAAFRFKKTLD